jgi:hypothetical protein
MPWFGVIEASHFRNIWPGGGHDELAIDLMRYPLRRRRK